MRCNQCAAGKCRWPFWQIVGLLVALAIPATAEEEVEFGESLAPNGTFAWPAEADVDQPARWTLSGGEGCWGERDWLEVSGDGTEASANHWRSEPVALEPGGLYRFEMLARRSEGSGGCAVSGPTFANRDQYGLGSEWSKVGHVFRVPDGMPSATLRVGQWKAAGSCQFDSVRLVRVLPVHTAVGSMLLGQGESIRDGCYRFGGTFSHAGSNYHRTLLRTNTAFNSDRWTFSTGNEVVYRFELPGCQFKDGRIVLNVNHYIRGECQAEVSTDGKSWQTVAQQGEVGAAEATLPESLFPAEAIYLRLRAEGASSFQVNRVEFDAALVGDMPEGSGKTVYAEPKRVSIAGGGRSVSGQKPLPFEIERATIIEPAGGTKTRIAVRLENRSENPLWIRPSVRSVSDGVELSAFDVDSDSSRRLLPSNSSRTLRFVLPATEPGKHEYAVSLALVDQGSDSLELHFSITVPDYYRTDYGEMLVGGKGTALWWCDASHKVPLTRTLPEKSGEGVRMAAARNDREAVQVVVRPEKDLAGLRAMVSEFRRKEGGGRIGADRIQVLRAYYHFVDHPTDVTGVRDYWPDALPPLEEPLEVKAGRNQPLWVLVHVPKDAAPGDYLATLKLEADGFTSEVPIQLHVWDFALPKRNHLETAFGLSVGNIFRYHGLKTEADKRKVLDLYHQSFADHRISPYDPTPLDPIRVEFLPKADPPRAEVDFAAFDKAMERAVEEFGFTNFRLNIQGMGGGTFHARYEPKIAGFGEETPEYQSMFASQVRQIEAHLKEKGWLDMAYVYWFDEPDPKDYEFVANGMKRLKKYAPGLTRMITEQPSDAFDARVNVWCPGSHRYDQPAAEVRRAEGERFWWYVCTGPKAPYCTLFIDHPATELRVWYWQIWQRDIVGTLVWQSNYWTSTAAFPDPARPQDPYEDPMGYRSGYSTPAGVKAFWGNGDGRFIYPPLAAATPSAEPVIAAPVTSIRWEMLREGVEDYEYLYMLRELLAAKGDNLPADEREDYEDLLEVPESITENMTAFTTHAGPIHERRRQIAEAIEGLQAK